jgi:hypothetical protein
MESYIKKQLTSRGLKNGENVFLDIEPWHPMDWCFCDSCRTSFAKTYQLKTTPSAQQILKQYSDKWSEFRCAQTAAIIGLIANTCRKFYPDVKIYNYDYVLDFRDPKYRQRFRAVANDSQLNEQYFDAHVSSYYSIVDKYACDMMDINVRNLKKEYIVLGALDKIGYLARERVLSPKRMRMMLLAAACNGANGFGLFPGNYIDGLYLQMFNQSMKLIAELEDFFNNGTRVGTLASLKPRPYVVHNININNKITTITRPKWNDFFAFRVHKTDSKTLISLFNYHPKLPLFVDLNLKLSPGKYTAFNMSSKRRILPAKDKEFWSENTLREFHAKVPSMDVAFICFRPYHTTDTALPADLCTAFNTEFEHEKSKFDFSILNPIESNGLKVIPDVLDGGIPAVTIQSKHQQILINPEDSGAIISWQTDGKTLFGSHNNVGKQARFMGIGRFYLPARYRRDDKAQKCKIISAEIINGCATLKLRRIQENLIQIDKIYQLRNDSNTLEIDWKLKNIGKTALKIAFWVHNYPTLGTWDNPSTKLKFKVSNGKEKQIFKQPVAEFFPYIDAPPTVSGPGKKQSKEKLAVSRAEAINAVTGAGIRFDAVHEQLAGLYVWSSLNPTLEWIYKEIKLAPGNEWSTKLRLTPFKSK